MVGVRGGRLLALGCAGSLLIAACGGDGEASNTAPPAPETTVAAPDTVADTVEDDADDDAGDAPDTTSDTSEVPAADGEPITIGFVNMEDGPAAQTTLGESAEAARRYINDVLGGIDGRPLEFEKCSTNGTPESSAQCANQMVSAGVPLVYQGFDSGNTALHPILDAAGIPWVGQEPFTASDYESGYFFAGSQVAYALGAGAFLRDVVQPERITILSYTTPTALAANERYLGPAMEAAGAEVEIVHVEYGAPDVSVQVSAAMANDPDAIVFFMGDADCTKVVVAADQLGYDGTVVAGPCSDFAKDAGPAAEGVISFADVYSVEDLSRASDRAKADVAAFSEAMAEHAPTRPLSMFNQFVFAGLVNLSTVLRTIDGDITPESVVAALEATEDVPSFMADTFGCKGELTALAPSVCSASVLAMQVRDGALTQASDGFIYGPSLFE